MNRPASNGWKHRLQKRLQKTDLAFQRKFADRFIDHLPKILMVGMVAVVLLSTMRIYFQGKTFLRNASARELAALVATTDPDRPDTDDEGRTDSASATDLYGNGLGYQFRLSDNYSFGTIATSDGVELYTFGGSELGIGTPIQRDSPFYNLLKPDETDQNALRMIPTAYQDTLTNAYKLITGIHSSNRSDITLTISHAVQTAVYQFMGEQGIDGTCAAYRPDTGEVLCLVSNNAPRDLYRINENLGTGRPASTFKVLLCALLEEEGIDVDSLQYSCKGSYTLSDGTQVRCSGQAAHGTHLTVADALGKSCNCFFAQAIEDHLDWAKTRQLLADLGMRVNGSLSSDSEAAQFSTTLGNLTRDPSSVILADGNDLFSDVWSMIGEGKTAVSPIDMLTWCGALVQDGTAAVPTPVQTKKTETVQYFTAETAQAVYAHWLEAYQQYYDDSLYTEHITVAKTGTDQLDSNGNEAFTLMGYSEPLDTVFFIRINNAVRGTETLEAKPVDVANVLLDAVAAS